MDYKKFLGREELVTAPVLSPGVAWIGPRRAVIPGARLGWHRLVVRGRDVRITDAATPEEVSEALKLMPVLHGHVARLNGRLHLCANGCVFLIHLPPVDEPLQIAKASGRLWDSGDLIWEKSAWESGVEEVVREKLEQQERLGFYNRTTPEMRLAYALSLADKVGREVGIPASPMELMHRVVDIVQDGRPAVVAILEELARARAEHPPMAVEPLARTVPSAQRALDAIRALEDRLEQSLSKANCRLLSSRRLRDGLVEVRWLLDGDRYETIVEEASLRVRDAGICLRGEDAKWTLDSLPSVIREAIRTDVLHVTRFWED